jgi:hypothetical protein
MAFVGGGLIVTGIVWIFQGLGVLKGSFMTGQAFWGWMGALAMVLGVPVLIRGLRRS